MLNGLGDWTLHYKWPSFKSCSMAHVIKCCITRSSWNEKNANVKIVIVAVNLNRCLWTAFPILYFIVLPIASTSIGHLVPSNLACTSCEKNLGNWPCAIRGYIMPRQQSHHRLSSSLCPRWVEHGEELLTNPL
jgi:hypothetical protein